MGFESKIRRSKSHLVMRLYFRLYIKRCEISNEIYDHSENTGKFSLEIVKLMETTLDEIDFDEGKN